MNTPRWAFYWLIAAGLYNLLWGAYVIIFPAFSFQILGATPPNYLELWQCIGMIVGVYGIGYIIAATDPNRHWPIVLVGFLGKIFGPIGFVKALYTGVFPLTFGINIIFNDLRWWLPFYLILKRAYLNYFVKERDRVSQSYDLSFKDPTLIVAVRHHGCIFTKEALKELNNHFEEIKNNGLSVKILHMDSTGEFDEFAKKYLNKISWSSISDPERVIYNMLNLRRGSILEVLGPSSFFHGFISFIKGNFVGPLRGDGFQLSGLAIIDKAVVKDVYVTKKASEKLPIEQFVKTWSLR
jgi:hypothetical protein